MCAIPSHAVSRVRWILIALVCAAIVALSLVIAGRTGGASEFWGGYEEALARVTGGPWWTLWVLPGLLLALVAALALGIRTSPAWARDPADQGRRTAFLLAGVAVLILSLCAPVAVIGFQYILTDGFGRAAEAEAEAEPARETLAVWSNADAKSGWRRKLEASGT